MNKIILIGNLAREVEMTETNSGKPVAQMRLAVDREFGDRGTDFFEVVAYGSIAENCGKYLRKGRKIAVFGALNIREWTDHRGDKRTVTQIVARDVEFLSPRGEGDAPSAARPGSAGRGAPQSAPPPRQAPKQVTLEEIADDEDLPF